MLNYFTNIFTRRFFFACLMSLSMQAVASDYSRLIIFGDSLSDPGNAFAIRGEQTLPPYDTLDTLLVPSAPYARGGHHLSNGETWIEQLGQALKLKRSTGPAWRESGMFTNYAVGGARARDDGINVNLSDQVGAFTGLPNSGELLDGALVVLWFGGNDVRDAVANNDPGAIGQAVTAIVLNISALHAAGARDFLIGNSPDIGLVPAITIADQGTPLDLAAIATGASMSFNGALEAQLGILEGALPGINIRRLNAFQFIQDTVNDPQSVGLKNADSACVMPGIPPYTCKKPDDYLFWDGIHPTRAGHGVLADEVMTILSN